MTEIGERIESTLAESAEKQGQIEQEDELQQEKEIFFESTIGPLNAFREDMEQRMHSTFEVLLSIHEEIICLKARSNELLGQVEEETNATSDSESGRFGAGILLSGGLG
mmetsp:Transcript_32029/g.43904  ORF Transcript_32029/g.43904 Transcript_32029/m.43904 type:complete len:109 (+) Transcript_32029:119-445(+)